MYRTFTDNEIKAFENNFNNLLNTAKENSSAVQIKGEFQQGICPYMQFITFDALKTEDYPHNIAMNSIYLCFTIDYQAKKVELHSTGSTWLSPKDKAENSPYKYLAMRGIAKIAAEDYGVKKFRKQTFKNTEDLFKKMETYYKAVIDALIQYTGGYPYKQGIVPPDGENVA